ncbi:MAG: DUF1700 domain-containing protein [Coriobacteriales bacterium]|jgi:uncharacterized membrane protein|nr:DUF1700 domain-containing protein [Coriobacteriales bacterium]
MMDRATYLARLEQELGGLATFDRQNILAYYNEFLQDAEAEGKADVALLLGSPHVLAAQIKADIAMGGFEGIGAQGGFATAPVGPMGMTSPPPAATAPSAPTGTPSGPPPPPPVTAIPAAAAASAGAGGAPPWTGGPAAAAAAQPPYAQVPYGTTGGAPPKERRGSGMHAVWIVVLAILALPIGLPVLIAVVAVIVSVLVTLVALLASFAAVVFSLLVAGVLAAIAGVLLLFSNSAVGLFYIGSGLVILGLGVLAGMGLWHLGRLCVKGVARLFNGIRRKLTKRERGAQ